MDQLNDYCSARGRAKFVADWLPGGGTIARTLWGSHNGDQLGFYQLSTADLNNITGENSGGQTVAMHAASEGLKAAGKYCHGGVPDDRLKERLRGVPLDFLERETGLSRHTVLRRSTRTIAALRLSRTAKYGLPEIWATSRPAP